MLVIKKFNFKIQYYYRYFSANCYLPFLQSGLSDPQTCYSP